MRVFNLLPILCILWLFDDSYQFVRFDSSADRTVRQGGAFGSPITGIKATTTIASSMEKAFMATKLSAATAPNHLNLREYPVDNYDHILGINDEDHKNSKLQEICRLRIADVELSKAPIDTDGCGIDRSFYVSSEDLENEIKEFDEAYGPPLNLTNRIKLSYPTMAIAAEFKKASPSKGDINADLDPVQQCLQYANVGASVISVLTEFKHFKGTLSDLKRVRHAIQSELGALNRPAILRKDFIIDRYQILEARSHGADTVLLIVAVLGVNQLKDLMRYSRSFGMEPLVEVHTEQEMEIALDCGAKVIGVNNRNLHNFQLDLETTNRAVAVVQRRGMTWQLSPSNMNPDVLIAALSGITSVEDVNMYRDVGVSCCLIGETLMKSPDPQATIQQLVSGGQTNKDDSISNQVNNSPAVMVKACGFTHAADVAHALQAGINLLGLIFVPASKRFVSITAAQEIVSTVRKYGERSEPIQLGSIIEKFQTSEASDSGVNWYSNMASALSKITLRKPLTVGVFQDQSIDEINEIVRTVGIDLVQLHGEESPEIISRINAPCIKVLHIPQASRSDSEESKTAAELLVRDIESFRNKAIAILLDTKTVGAGRGGTGETFDWSIVNQLHGLPVILAGGLTSDNVASASMIQGVVAVDVASGIENQSLPGRKDAQLVTLFIKNAKGN